MAQTAWSDSIYSQSFESGGAVSPVPRTEGQQIEPRQMGMGQTDMWKGKKGRMNPFVFILMP